MDNDLFNRMKLQERDAFQEFKEKWADKLESYGAAFGLSADSAHRLASEAMDHVLDKIWSADSMNHIETALLVYIRNRALTFKKSPGDTMG